MSDPTAYVYVDLDGATQAVGKLWTTVDRGNERASFEYDDTWLRNERRFALEPALTLDAAAHHTQPGRALFGALGDSAPDRWGRMLMQRNARATAVSAHEPARTLYERDYLLGVTDETRQGALRFRRTENGSFERPPAPDGVPPLVTLPKLLAASDLLQEGDETDETIRALRLLMAPGSSLGGARPKASVRDTSGRLHIAKFPAKGDEWNIERWEAVALTLAKRAGIATPEFALRTVKGRDLLVVRRFDRHGSADAFRIPFLSAMSALNARDHEVRSYVEIAQFLRQHGADTGADLQALWRRMIFAILINNTDDHLRNHGFLLSTPAGWRLSPVYDINPVPTDIRERFLSTAIGEDGDTTASLELAFRAADQFGLKVARAREVARDVATTVQAWDTVARKLKVPAQEFGRMSSAFSHPELAAAAR